MARICYMPQRFNTGSRTLIAQANTICEEYRRQGYDLTLRQLYYQFVSRDLIANKDAEYKRLGQIVSNARLAGELDWDYIVDRTRNLRHVSHWDTPGDVIDSAAASYRLDKWATQPTRVEVWIEKDALVGVLESVCPELDVAWFSCRGYTSQSEMWSAAQRLGGHIAGGQRVHILHLGDHDPSGLDMTRDISERLSMFVAQDVLGAHAGWDAPEYVEEVGEWLTVDRIALNMDQIRAYKPPPNPAKLSDARATAYIARFGSSSWELDALEPTVLVGLIRAAVALRRNEEAYAAIAGQEAEDRRLLNRAAHRWEDVAAYLEEAA